MTQKRAGGLTWIQTGDKWYSHWHQYRMRARSIAPTRWIVGYEVSGAWVVIGNGPTLDAVADIAREWATK